MKARIVAILLAFLIGAPLLVSAPQEQTIRYVGAGAAGLPALQSRVVTLTPTVIRLLFTTPAELVPTPGVGFAILPTTISFFKQAGTAYTIGSAGATATTINGITLYSFTATGYFNQTTTMAYLMNNVGNGSQAYNGVSLTAFANAPINLAIAGGNLSGGTGDVIVTIWYRIWPV